MSKNPEEKFFDVRTNSRYIKKSVISQKDLQDHLKALPNDEENFDLVMFEEDDIGVGGEMSEDEINAMPTITEESIGKFDFVDEDED